jgi:hypothetical protein
MYFEGLDRRFRVPALWSLEPIRRSKRAALPPVCEQCSSVSRVCLLLLYLPPY